MTTRTKEDVLLLAKEVKAGNQDAFRDLEEVAKPLLVSLSNKFASYHSRFEFDDFYSIGLQSLHKACMNFEDGNPSFLSYAKVFILRSFWHEIEHWNQDKRDIFSNSEVSFEMSDDYQYQDDLDNIVFTREFRENTREIIDECFDKKKASIMKMYIFDDAKVKDIAMSTKLDYKYVHKVIERGVVKIKTEYVKRYIP